MTEQQITSTVYIPEIKNEFDIIVQHKAMCRATINLDTIHDMWVEPYKVDGQEVLGILYDSIAGEKLYLDSFDRVFRLKNIRETSIQKNILWTKMN